MKTFQLDRQTATFNVMENKWDHPVSKPFRYRASEIKQLHNHRFHNDIPIIESCGHPDMADLQLFNDLALLHPMSF